MSCGFVWVSCAIWEAERGRVAYSLVCEDGFAVAAFHGEGFFAGKGVWCLQGQCRAGW